MVSHWGVGVKKYLGEDELLGWFGTNCTIQISTCTVAGVVGNFCARGAPKGGGPVDYFGIAGGTCYALLGVVTSRPTLCHADKPSNALLQQASARGVTSEHTLANKE